MGTQSFNPRSWKAETSGFLVQASKALGERCLKCLCVKTQHSQLWTGRACGELGVWSFVALRSRGTLHFSSHPRMIVPDHSSERLI